VPLPPYIRRPDGPLPLDRARYQTIFSAVPGAVAAPTAGLHFTDELFEQLRGRGIEVVRLTLHVGPATFLPVRCDDVLNHSMESEWCEIPAATATHKPIAHAELVERLVEALSFRQIGVVSEEYAVSKDGMRMFGVLDLSSGFEGCRFAIGLRNSHDKSFRLSCTVGLRVFVCENLAFHGEYTPVLAKHSKNFSLEDSLAIGVDRMQRNVTMSGAPDCCRKATLPRQPRLLEKPWR